MDIPVFLFSGFLESGKTTFIRDTLEDPGFTEGDKILLLVCEEGEEEYDEKQLSASNTVIEYIEDEESFTESLIASFALKHSPKKVIIEWNGMWRLEKLMTMKLPKKWQIVQMITTVAAPTFDLYLNNMRSVIMEQFTNSDMVIFNRCDENTKIGSYRRNVKAVNPAAQVYFENADGTEPDKNDTLPYDINADVIELEDEDFGIWFVDAMDEPEKYAGKTIVTKALVYKNMRLPEGTFIPGRYAMTCCADDVRFIGPFCKSLLTTDEKIRRLKKNECIKLTAKVVVEDCKFYKGEGPVLYASEIEPAALPKNEFVYFN
ncbi:MAG: GTP-binding protein [Thermoflexaceae bacterium]|nr:GTP-binding protein [Thermoflexaceae bacterium]